MQKRYEVRRSTIIPTEVMAPYWNEPLDLVAADLSPRGMYLLSEDMPQIGEYLFCSFALQGEEPEYSFLSRVQRVNWHRRKTERYRPGFGVEFLDVDSHGRETLLRYFSPGRYHEFYKGMLEEFPHLENAFELQDVSLIVNLWEEWNIQHGGGPAATASGVPSATTRPP